RPFPMPKIAQAYGDRKLVKALGNTKFDGVPIRVIGLPQARNSAPYDGRPACRGNKNCIPICPIQAKCDATVHVRKAIKNKAVLIAQAVATELGVDANGSVNAVVYKTWDGQTHTVAGRVVVRPGKTIERGGDPLLSKEGKGEAQHKGQVQGTPIERN